MAAARRCEQCMHIMLCMSSFDDWSAVDPGHLVALDLLLSTRSVTAAARRLGISQSAMSHRLRVLRDALGDPLLVGSARGLTRTPRAEALAAPLAQALATLRAAMSTGAPFAPRTSTATFTIATTDYGELVALPAALERLRADAPGVALTIVPLGGELVTAMASGAVDVAITATRGLPPSLRQRTLAVERFRVALRRGHPALRGRTRLSLAAYCGLDHLLVAPRGLPGSAVDDALAAVGRTRRIALRVPNFVSAPFLVANSDLVTTLGEPLLRAASRYADLTVVAPPLPLPTSTIVMVWHERTHRSPPHVWLRELIVAAMTASLRAD